MYCTNCGKEMKEGAEICTSCGVRPFRVVNNCYSCGKEVKEEQELCLNCGVNPRKQVQGKFTTNNNLPRSKGVNAFLGLVIVGLPQLIFFKQTTKGITLIALMVVLGIFSGGMLGLIVCIVSAIDAYQLTDKVNQGQPLGDWEFFWN